MSFLPPWMGLLCVLLCLGGLAAWLVQLREIVQTRTLYQHIMLRNQLQNLFLKITEQLPAHYQGGRQFSRVKSSKGLL